MQAIKIALIMEINVSRVTRSGDKREERVLSAPRMPDNSNRPNHAVSAYSVLPPRNKILPGRAS